MNYSLIAGTNAITISILLAVGMLVSFALGRLLRRYWKLDEVETRAGVGMLQTSIYALFGFILAFTFGMSGQRYETIRDVYIEEAQAFGTAAGRSDLYADSVRQAFRTEFKAYLEARISTYTNVYDKAQVASGKAQSSAIESRLWRIAAVQTKQPNMHTQSIMMIPALNGLFDVALKRDILMKAHIPDTIVYMLLILALVSSFIGGVTTTSIGKRDWLIVCCFVLFTSLVVYITLDLGRPLRGIVRADAAAASMNELRKMFE